jgi:hypothetical protein
MTSRLPAPEVVRCYRQKAVGTQLPVMALHWPCDDPVGGEQSWNLPEGTSIHGPPPRLFGLRLLRGRGASYSLRLVWDRTTLAWDGLSRDQILGSCLRPLLAALGADLWHLLDQVQETTKSVPGRAA